MGAMEDSSRNTDSRRRATGASDTVRRGWYGYGEWICQWVHMWLNPYSAEGNV